MTAEKQHPIRVVVRRTGLSQHVIRAWERRYGAVEPLRTSTNRRLYSDEDIERLLLLRRTTEAGHSIGRVARLSTERLLELVQADEVDSVEAMRTHGVRTDDSALEAHLGACLKAAAELDVRALEVALSRAAVSLSQPVLIEQLIIPLMQRIGDLWREGTFRVAHEHFASAVVRTMLGNLGAVSDTAPWAPTLIATTPAGQLHEFGVLMAAVTAASEGWNITYLGPNLPAEEIAAAAEQNGARVVALSLVYPADDPRLPLEIHKLRRLLSEGVSVVVGGRAAESYREALDAAGAVVLHDMNSLRLKLESLRAEKMRDEV